MKRAKHEAAEEKRALRKEAKNIRSGEKIRKFKGWILYGTSVGLIFEFRTSLQK